MESHDPYENACCKDDNSRGDSQPAPNDQLLHRQHFAHRGQGRHGFLERLLVRLALVPSDACQNNTVLGVCFPRGKHQLAWDRSGVQILAGQLAHPRPLPCLLGDLVPVEPPDVDDGAAGRDDGADQ